MKTSKKKASKPTVWLTHAAEIWGTNGPTLDFAEVLTGEIHDHGKNVLFSGTADECFEKQKCFRITTWLIPVTVKRHPGATVGGADHWWRLFMEDVAKHTPGPWICRETYSNGEPQGRAVTSGAHFICTPEAINEGQQEANARLIAAAPELLAACKEAVVVVGRVPGTHKLHNLLNSVIAKAEGR